MKSLLSAVLLLTVSFTFAQQASKVNNAQNVPQSITNPTVLLGALPFPIGEFQVYIKDDILWETYNINNLANYIKSVGDTLYVSDATPLVVNWEDVEDKPTFFDGDYNSLTNQPTIPTNTGTVTSVSAGTGLDFTTITSSGSVALSSATQASLGKADTSIQPGDNLSQLTNDLGLLSGVSVATTSATTYTVIPATNLYMVTFTGTDSTFTLPNVNDVTGATIYIINNGSGVITLESEDIWEGGFDLDEMEVLSGTVIRLVSDGIKFRVI